jgi:hypothetical protein
MSQKTICDKCGGDCINFAAHISVEIRHTTKNGQRIDEDEYLPLDICYQCQTQPLVLVELIRGRMLGTKCNDDIAREIPDTSLTRELQEAEREYRELPAAARPIVVPGTDFP